MLSATWLQVADNGSRLWPSFLEQRLRHVVTASNDACCGMPSQDWRSAFMRLVARLLCSAAAAAGLSNITLLHAYNSMSCFRLDAYSVAMVS